MFKLLTILLIKIELFMDDFLTVMFSILKVNFLQSEKIGTPLIHNIITDLNLLENDLKKIDIVSFYHLFK